MQSIDMYNNSEIILQKKESKLYKIFIIVVLVFLTGAILLMTLYKYDKISKVKAVVKNSKINLTVTEDNLKLLSNNNVLVNDKEYKVVIESISDVIYDSNYNTYYEISLYIDLEGSVLVENNVLDINILLGKTTLYQSLKERIKEGIR